LIQRDVPRVVEVDLPKLDGRADVDEVDPLAFLAESGELSGFDGCGAQGLLL
jgi:hypothetical protein